MEDKELNNVVLEQAAGGADSEVRTEMICDVCGYGTVWAGDYLNGQMYMCPEATDPWPVHGRCPATEPSFHGVQYAP